MQLANRLTGLRLRPGGAAVAIGTFDGVHLGHQALFRHLQNYCRQHDYSSVVITFEPRPLDVLRPEQAPPRLTTAEERRDAIAACGVDVLVVLPFSEEFSQKTASEFLKELQTSMPLQGLFVGYDFRFGAGGQGDVAFLRQRLSEEKIAVEVLSPQAWKGQVISSTRVRQFLAAGDVRSAAGMLGRPYSVRGKVVHGDARGRQIGFPTANLALPEGKARPKDGVYAVRVRVQDDEYDGVANLGRRPTFDGEELRLEAHLFDFNGDLYDRVLELDFIERLRGERRFSSFEELKEQISLDASAARKVLSKVLSRE